MMMKDMTTQERIKKARGKSANVYNTRGWICCHE